MKFILVIAATALVQGGPRIQISRLGEYALKASRGKVAQEVEAGVRSSVTWVYGSYTAAVEKRCVSIS
ncbi:MAG: hypothetical protein KA271_00935 [Propionivibrio sp.]|nr:hypothetical protein [Propionivibrio sp.]